MMGGDFQAVWDWLNANTGAVAALAAIIAAVIAVPVWLATRRQAMLARRMFEASNTPYVTIRVEEPTDTSEPGVLSFNMVLHNQSTALAHVLQWEVYAILTDLELRHHRLEPGYRGDSVEGTFAPSEQKVMQLSFFDARFPSTDLPLRLICMLAYRGSGSSIHITDFEADRGNTNRSWMTQECRMRRPEDMLLAALGMKHGRRHPQLHIMITDSKPHMPDGQSDGQA
jgi:hypothetical protein